MLNVVIVTARCRHNSQLFGMRFEEQGRGSWIADWAFPLDERLTKKEGYDQNEIKGSFDFAHDYPGCPFCHSLSIFRCHCGKISCWAPRKLPCYEVCAWCHSRVELTENIDSLWAGGDR